jgi:hypothetical protein
MILNIANTGPKVKWRQKQNVKRNSKKETVQSLSGKRYNEKFIPSKAPFVMVETDASKRNTSRNKTNPRITPHTHTSQNIPTVAKTSREERGHEGTRDHVEDV